MPRPLSHLISPLGLVVAEVQEVDLDRVPVDGRDLAPTQRVVGWVTRTAQLSDLGANLWSELVIYTSSWSEKFVTKQQFSEWSRQNEVKFQYFALRSSGVADADGPIILLH